MRFENWMITFAGIAALLLGTNAQAVQIYDADFSGPAVGFSHTTGSPPAAGPQTAAGINYTLGYDTTPSTDSADNFFITDGTQLTSRDFGGGAYFISNTIDVTAYDTVDIAFLGATAGAEVFNNTPTEFFQWNYSIDGGPAFTETTFDDGSLDKTFTGVDVSGATSLTVGFSFNVNGGGDGFDMTSITVDGFTGGGPGSGGSGKLLNEDFEAFAATGFAPSPGVGQLDSDIWKVTGASDGDGTFGGTHAGGTDFGRGLDDGFVSTGGVYAFETDVDNEILGLQPGGSDYTSGAIFAKVENTTGEILDELTISYDLFWLNDQPRANDLNFAYSLDDSTYIPVGALDFITPELADNEPLWQSIFNSVDLTSLGLAPGGFIYLRWSTDDVSGSGSRDELGIDNVMVAYDLGDSNVIPAPAALPAGLAMVAMLAARRRRR